MRSRVGSSPPRTRPMRPARRPDVPYQPLPRCVQQSWGPRPRAYIWQRGQTAHATATAVTERHAPGIDAAERRRERRRLDDQLSNKTDNLVCEKQSKIDNKRLIKIYKYILSGFSLLDSTAMARSLSTKYLCGIPSVTGGKHDIFAACLSRRSATDSRSRAIG